MELSSAGRKGRKRKKTEKGRWGDWRKGGQRGQAPVRQEGRVARQRSRQAQCTGQRDHSVTAACSPRYSARSAVCAASSAGKACGACARFKHMCAFQVCCAWETEQARPPFPRHTKGHHPVTRRQHPSIQPLHPPLTCRWQAPMDRMPSRSRGPSSTSHWRCMGSTSEEGAWMPMSGQEKKARGGWCVCVRVWVWGGVGWGGGGGVSGGAACVCKELRAEADGRL
jgi:hypothetical protein